MKSASKMGLMAAIIGLSAAMFGRKRDKQDAKITPQREGGMFWNPQAIYIPRRGKFKGYMRDNRNWGKKR
jgi:hypothetical protein